MILPTLTINLLNAYLVLGIIILILDIVSSFAIQPAEEEDDDEHR